MLQPYIFLAFGLVTFYLVLIVFTADPVKPTMFTHDVVSAGISATCILVWVATWLALVDPSARDPHMFVGLLVPVILGSIDLLTSRNTATFTRGDTTPTNDLVNANTAGGHAIMSNAFAVTAIMGFIATKTFEGRRLILVGFMLCLVTVMPDFMFRERSLLQTSQIAFQKAMLNCSLGLLVTGILHDIVPVLKSPSSTLSPAVEAQVLGSVVL